MNCDCKTSIEAELLVNFKGANPEGQDHQTSLTGYGLGWDGSSMHVRGYMPVESTFRHTTKTGATKTKTVKQSMFFSYCPFCGVAA